MPPAVPLVAAAAGYAASAAIGTGLLATLAGVVVSSAVNQLGGRALGKKPKSQAFTQEAQGRAVIIRSSVETHKIVYGRSRVSGPLVFAATVDSGIAGDGTYITGTNVFLHLVIPLAGHEVDAIETVYINDRAVSLNGSGYVTDAPYNLDGYFHAQIRKYTGTADQAADPVLLAEVPGWTTDHRLRGIPYLAVKLQTSNEVFPLGIPNFSAVVKGKKVYDPRSGLTAWSDNAALCTRDYLMSECDVDTSRFTDDYTMGAANVCDEPVTLASGATAARYTCNGVADTGVSRRENLNALTASMAGEVIRVGGNIRIHAGAYDAPVGTITDDILVDDLQIRGRTPRSELVNTVRGTYVDPALNYQPTDFPPVTNSTYVTQDNGQVYDKDLELPFTNSPEAAQRIAKAVMEVSRQGITVEATVMHHALQYACWDVVNVTQDLAGFSAKPFRIKRFKMASAPAGAITLVLQEESSASYDWNSGEATVIDPAPDTNLPNPLLVQPPGSPVVTESLYAPLDGSAARSKASVTWPPSPDAFVREYQLERKLAADASYTVLGRTVATTMEVFDLQQGTHTFRVKAINTLGVSSAYASTTTEIFGLTAPPAALSNFSLNAISNNAHLSWDQSEDLDVRIGGNIRVRWTPDLVSPSWSSAVDIGPALPGVATQAVVPLLNGTYLAKAVDSSGNESTTAATIKSTVADVVKMNRVATLEEAPGFTGLLTNLVVLDGALQLTGDVSFDSIGGNFDDAQGFFDAGDGSWFSEAPAFYEFTPEIPGGSSSDPAIDLGKVVTSRLTASITAEVYDASNTFDQAAGDFDDRLGLFDGDDVTGIDVWLEVYTSDDGVTWDLPRRFVVGDYTARAFRFELSVRNTNPSLNVRVSQLSVTVDMPDVTDSDTLNTSASGVTAVTFARDFFIVPDVGVTIQNAATGDYPVVQNVTETGFDLGVKNSGGSFVAKTTAWAANGY